MFCVSISILTWLVFLPLQMLDNSSLLSPQSLSPLHFHSTGMHFLFSHKNWFLSQEQQSWKAVQSLYSLKFSKSISYLIYSYIIIYFNVRPGPTYKNIYLKSPLHPVSSLQSPQSFSVLQVKLCDMHFLLLQMKSPMWHIPTEKERLKYFLFPDIFSCINIACTILSVFSYSTSIYNY